MVIYQYSIRPSSVIGRRTISQGRLPLADLDIVPKSDVPSLTERPGED